MISARRPAVRKIFQVALAIAASSVLAGDPSTPTPKPGAEWQQKHAANVAAAKAGGIDVVFLGDSITEMWNAEGRDVWAKSIAPLKAANFGISADKVENVLWRVQNGEFDGIQPKTVVLLCGINNTWGAKKDDREKTGTAIAAGLSEVIKTIRAKSPQTNILLLAIYPIADGADTTVKTANSALAKLDDGKAIRFLDLGPKLADADGKLAKENTKDGLHLSAKGYEIVATSIMPLLTEMIGAKAEKK
jgi:lysophospholipase L1-like esterase